MALPKGLLWKLLALLYLIVVFPMSSLSQGQEEEGRELVEIEEELSSIFLKLGESQHSPDSMKLSLCHQIMNLFLEVLENDSSFHHSFSKLGQCGRLLSPDQMVRVFNWNIVLSNGTFRYFGILHIKKKNGDFAIYPLTDKGFDMPNPESKVLEADEWYGCLYYEIIEKSKGKQKYYTLLGWDGRNHLSNRKVIEVLRISSLGKPRFGAPVFSLEASKPKRVIFEFADQANMALSYNQDLEMIVFDHLSPSKPSYQGNYSFYGPDFSYDGLEFIDGKWVFTPMVDARNPKPTKKQKGSTED